MTGPTEPPDEPDLPEPTPEPPKVLPKPASSSTEAAVSAARAAATSGTTGPADEVGRPAGEIAVRAWKSEAAVVLSAGGYETTWLPEVGMLGVSLKWHGLEVVAMPKTPAQVRKRSTSGIPLLYPWANRLGSRRFTLLGKTVDLRRKDLHVDERGLPIHGTLVGDPHWRVARAHARANDAMLLAERWWERPEDLGVFPFPHHLEVAVKVSARGLDVTTTVTPTAKEPVPVAFGWHPYLAVPEEVRRNWELALPPRSHLLLDRRLLPNGEQEDEPQELAPLGSRDLDDLFVPSKNRLSLAGKVGAVSLSLGSGYTHAQVYAPANRAFACLEPMTAPTNALVDGVAPIVEPGDRFRATFRLSAGAR
jgi:galactose mutarotase-like enzyme